MLAWSVLTILLVLVIIYSSLCLLKDEDKLAEKQSELHEAKALVEERDPNAVDMSESQVDKTRHYLLHLGSDLSSPKRFQSEAE